MILASLNMGNKAVTVNCEFGEFTVSRDDFDSLDWESAAQVLGKAICGNPVAIAEWHAFQLQFDIATQLDLVRVMALSL